MRILVLHNAYRNFGGEDAAVASEVEMLRQAGMDVRFEAVSNQSLSSPIEQARAFFNVAHDPRRKVWIQSLCAEYRPDVVHIHNFFPLLTTAVHQGAAEMGIPVVQTLHNYRLLCANALFLREGRACEKCLKGNNSVALLSRCYRGSFSATLAAMWFRHRSQRDQVWSAHVHRFVALSDFAREKFIQGGLAADRIVVKPNCVDDVGAMEYDREGALYVGRLSQEKGIETLLEAWKSVSDLPLTIVGDGPDRARLMARAPSNVVFTGHLRRDAITLLMRRAAMLIVPSLAYETFGLTIAEAFSAGLPVVASNIGAPAELVGRSGAGLLFEVGNSADLARVVSELWQRPELLEQFGASARLEYLRRFTPERNLSHLLEIYRDAAIQAASS